MDPFNFEGHENGTPTDLVKIFRHPKLNTDETEGNLAIYKALHDENKDFPEDLYLALATLDINYEEKQQGFREFLRLESRLHPTKFGVYQCVKNTVGTNSIAKNALDVYDGRNKEPPDGLYYSAKGSLKNAQVKVGKAQLLIHVYKVVTYYADQLKAEMYLSLLKF